MFPPGETVIAAGQGLERAILLDSQNVNVVFVSHIHIAHTASDPVVKRRNLVDGVFVRQLDIIKYIPCAQAGRKAFRAVPFRIDDLVRAVAQQQLGVDILRGLGDHARRAHVLEHGGNQQAAGEIRPDADKTEIDLTNDMVSGFDNTVLGKRTLTVTVGGLTTTFEVEVIERTVTSVSVENGKLAKHYSDGTTEETPLMDGTISDFMTSETGEKTMTLASENPCVVAYKDADGNYVALKTTANEDGSYSYVVPEEVTEVMVAVKGDLDGDGRINMKDLAQLRRNMAEGTVEGGLEQLLIDFNGDGVVNMKDMGILRRYLAGGYGVELGW